MSGIIIASEQAPVIFASEDVLALFAEVEPELLYISEMGPPGSGGDMFKSAYDSNGDGIVNAAETVPWAGVSGRPTVFPPDAHSHALVSALAAGFMAAADKAKLDGIAAGATANASDSALRDRSTHTGTQLAATISDFAAAVAATAAVTANTAKVTNATHTGEVTGSGALTIAANAVTNAKLAQAPANTVLGNNTGAAANNANLTTAQVRALINVADGATANASDASLRDRSTHTGTQVAATVSDFAEAVDDRVAALLVAGSNVTLSYNDAANTLTIAATGGSGLADGDKGDITVSGTGATLTIDAGVVSLAKLATMATSSLLGRSTAGTGAPEVLTPNIVKGILGYPQSALAEQITGAWSFGDGTGPVTYRIDGAAGTARDFAMQTNGVLRFRQRLDNLAETGSDAGSNFTWFSYGDTGALIGVVYDITRATRVVDFRVQPTLNGQALLSANDSVTDAKLANMPAWTIKVRNAATTGDPVNAGVSDFTTATPAGTDFVLGMLSTGELRKFAANATDAFLLGRANHTGTQFAATISDFAAAVAATAAVAANTAKVTNATHTGEVTGSGALTIAANAVTNAKLAQAPANTMLGNNTGAAANNANLTAAQVRALINVADGATANAADASLRDRSTHTGTQVAATVSDFAEAVDDRVAALLVAGSNVTLTYNDAANTLTVAASIPGGSGDVVGPASSTNNALALFDLATGKLLKNSVALLDSAGVLTRPAAAAPAAPAAGNVAESIFDFAGLASPAWRAPGGALALAQKHLGRSRVARWNPPGNAVTLPGVDGMAAPSPLGTATARNVAATNLGTRARRLGYVSAATAAAFCGHHMAAAQYTIGDGAGLGGFLYVCRFMVSDAAAVSGARMFVGLRNAVAAPTNVEPNTLVNCAGVADLSTSSNLHIVYGGSAAQTAIDLGANFPANSLSADMYELALYASPNSQDIKYRVERLGTAFVATGTLTGTVGTVVPNATTFLGHSAWRTNNATALACGLDVASLHIETDY